MLTLLAVLVLVPLLTFASLVYVRVGWDNTEAACDRLSSSETEYSQGFSLMPFGFTCEYGDTEVTRVWFTSP